MSEKRNPSEKKGKRGGRKVFVLRIKENLKGKGKRRRGDKWRCNHRKRKG